MHLQSLQPQAHSLSAQLHFSQQLQTQLSFVQQELEQPEKSNAETPIQQIIKLSFNIKTSYGIKVSIIHISIALYCFHQ